MIRLLKEIEWIFDYYFLYFLYNDRKRYRYYEWMENKWPDRFKKPADL